MSLFNRKPNIAKLEKKRNIDGLLRALDYKEPSVRINALRALGKIGNSRIVELIITKLKDNNRSVRKAAAMCLDKLKYQPTGVEKAYYLIVNNMWNELSILGSEAIDPIIQELKDEGSNVLKKAIDTFVAIGIPAVKPLIKALYLHKFPFLQIAAATALGRIGDKSAVQPLIDTLKSGEFQLTQVAAAAALGNIGDPQAVKPLIESLKHCKHNEIEIEAARALGKIGDQAAVEALIETLIWSRLPEIIITAAIALGEIGDDRAIEPMKDVLEQPTVLASDDVKKALRTALQMIGANK